MTGAMIVLAAALLMWPMPGSGLTRIATTEPHAVTAARARGQPRWLRAAPRPDPFAVAAAYDVFAVCLLAGLPVGVAAAVAAQHSPAPLAGHLERAAELLGLGADPVQAWTPGGDVVDPHFQDLAMLARRASRAGSSLAEGVATLAESTRQEAQTQALARAERAGVTISGPLGLCFLPAFVCLGIVPVVIGLAGGMLGQW
ncbi:hypothetical protein GOHSU_32_00080 [Gordonia hirsuta DSM 44140 = NBRC 16056]|uniref:Type II secretion system protein GspF domain-containing protein n=1 Tax=Gordonia hirsuta DSM 44140 = NBRC 16056 TaxID=1121927 RepID=L7LBR4_9ACTN|nr:type II secretion system F family protein [Gordonia hirsuta]GAC58191.1 hypothetical protein GOHSU_32_00080 [Gordonia hirsuta DSM 44140 = NBRC 16056]